MTFFTFPDLDSDFNSNLDCKLNGYIVLYRNFDTAWSWIQIPIRELESESDSVNVNKP